MVFRRIYDFLFVRPALWLGRLLWKGGDGFIIDGFGPDGVSARVLDVTRSVVRLQTGYLYHYAFAMLIGVAALHHLVHVRGRPLMASWPILSVVTFLPLVGALFIALLREDETGARNARWVALWTTLITFAISLILVWRSIRPRPTSSSSRSGPGSAAPSPTTWASTAFRCRS